MVTLKLKVNEKVLEKLLSLLKQFKSEDLEILGDSGTFESDKKYLENELLRSESDEVKFYTIEELDKILDKTINENET